MLNFSVLLVATLVSLANGYSVPYVRTRRSALYMRRGRGSLGREVSGGSSSGGVGSGVGQGSNKGGRSLNWCPIPDGQTLPKKDGEIGFLDTELPTMKVAATNPTGAVAAVKFEDQLYCFASSCPSCQVPLSKAKVASGNEESENAPRLGCSFCRASYSLKDGKRLKTPVEGSGGLFSGVVQNLVNSNSGSTDKPLKMYQLGERRNKLVIVVD